MVRRFLAMCILLLALLPVLAAAEVTATLDRDSVQLGETVTLNVTVQGKARGVDLPDLKVLSRDFELLGSSQNSSVNIINGKTTSQLTFGVALRPRHVGKLVIPALDVAGSRTAPLELEVTAADPDTAAAERRDVFMEAKVDPARVRVGQQASYVVRLYYAVGISGGALDAPQVDGVEMSRVGSDLSYDAERGGRNYRVLERRYALIPQRAGDIRIPAATFHGEAIDLGSPDSFFGATRSISARAPTVSLSVQAAPSDWGKSAWLPARQLSLQMTGWPEPQTPVRVGQPLNLTMTLQATGLPFEALPELTLPALDGAKVYPDKPATSTRNDGEWLQGRRRQTFAVVPERAGTLRIPATTVKWWNVLANRAEVAEIPARSITVLPAAGGANAGSPPPSAVAPDDGPVASPTVHDATPWRWIALGSIGLWLCSMLAWWWHHRRPVAAMPAKPASPTSPRQFRLAFLAAARGDDPAAQARSLLAWARAERPSIQHLGALAGALDDPAQQAAVVALQERQYADTAVLDVGADLAQAFKRGFVWRLAAAPDGASGLAPLYPFDLHDRH